MKPGSKYYPLFQHLRSLNQPQISLSIDHIATLIDGELSPNARQKRSWWSNRDSTSAVQSKAWMEAGYHTCTIDLSQQVITFQKFTAQYNVQTNDGVIIWDQAAIKALRKHMDMSQAQFSQELGVRRQTVSEWESGVYHPDRATAKHLGRIAEGQHFQPPPNQNHP
jgi:DNA-binding transcriptional regulator YiaG